MPALTNRTYGGKPWIPQFATEIDTAKCLGCGRCVKVCSHQCLTLESFLDDDDTERYTAAIVQRDDCIGCQACGKTCVRGCYTFTPLEV